MALGNAVTALGGDLGSVGINPAGSAVANYSQITLSPGLTITSSQTIGVIPHGSNTLPYFENHRSTRSTKFNIPNLGIMLNFETGRNSGLKNISFGFVSNQTASWNADVYASGTNNSTTFTGAMAYEASLGGYTSYSLGSADAYYGSDPWKYIVGYQSGMISTFDKSNNQYVGIGEVIYENKEVSLGGPIDQSYGRKVTGGKYDYLINIGANFSDFIYIGANLGLSSMDYAFNEYFKEVTQNPANFEIGFSDGSTAYFDTMKYSYGYRASGMGYYGKFGIIVTPGAGLRIGAAIQTPTINSIREEWWYDAETRFTDSQFNASASSPYGNYEYQVISPYRANLGLAYTLGNFALLSVDYEFSDYSSMKFKSLDDDREYFAAVNEEIRDIFCTSHMLRVGAEVKPLPELAIRAGYSLATTPEKYAYESKGISTIKNQNIAIGLGYSSEKSFFADLGVRRTFINDEYFMPYADYILDENNNVIDGAYTPEILNKSSLWKVILTLGWRF